jgi:tRNA pseudouridine38-40 synthase
MAPKRIRLTMRYDGTDFAGSQIQPGKRTVAGTLKAGLESIIGREAAREPRRIVAGNLGLITFASRTDTGVHADGNVCAFDAELLFPVERMAEVIAPKLPADLEIRDAVEVSADFNPRFAAIKRSYVYRVYRGTDVPVDRQRYVAMHNTSWDTNAVAEALALIEGEHCFLSFCKQRKEAGNGSCTIFRAAQVERGAEVEMWFESNRFLRNMICRIAAALIDVAKGKLTAGQIEHALRSEADFSSKPAPARGLTLVKIEF